MLAFEENKKDVSKLWDSTRSEETSFLLWKNRIRIIFTFMNKKTCKNSQKEYNISKGRNAQKENKIKTLGSNRTF